MLLSMLFSYHIFIYVMNEFLYIDAKSVYVCIYLHIHMCINIKFFIYFCYYISLEAIFLFFIKFSSESLINLCINHSIPSSLYLPIIHPSSSHTPIHLPFHHSTYLHIHPNPLILSSVHLYTHSYIHHSASCAKIISLAIRLKQIT